MPVGGRLRKLVDVIEWHGEAAEGGIVGCSSCRRKRGWGAVWKKTLDMFVSMARHGISPPRLPMLGRLASRTKLRPTDEIVKRIVVAEIRRLLLLSTSYLWTMESLRLSQKAFRPSA
ncbi:hypothetical protein FOZ63_028861 [Perkinsus olseni]|uniref:Uncharacterized protein n=1 Tax=Perkinsus olseni TaxID=32597 RepID=A0A7J6PWI2_PEROL|nr:hypothetical protein FOZ63_028861 [Perkinsus olseni]